MKLSGLSGKSIALVILVNEGEVVLRGRVNFRKDPRQGMVLQVTISGDEAESAGCPVFWIGEHRWRGQLTSGVDYGCDCLLDLSPRQRQDGAFLPCGYEEQTKGGMWR